MGHRSGAEERLLVRLSSDRKTVKVLEVSREHYRDSSRPNILASPPGRTLRRLLDQEGISQAELACCMGRPDQVVNDIVNARRPITAATALQLERALGAAGTFLDDSRGGLPAEAGAGGRSLSCWVRARWASVPRRREPLELGEPVVGEGEAGDPGGGARSGEPGEEGKSGAPVHRGDAAPNSRPVSHPSAATTSGPDALDAPLLADQGAHRSPRGPRRDAVGRVRVSGSSRSA